MQCQHFQQILNAVPSLTKQQKNILFETLSGHDSSSNLEQVIEASFAKAPKCPHFDSEDLQHWGTRNRRQRYRCKVCQKMLNAFSKIYLARLRHPEKWLQYLEGMTQS